MDGRDHHGSEVVRAVGRQFASGLELGITDVARIMRSRYTRLIGVLGQVEAGKTCLLTSMYLQVTGRHLLPSFRFVMSETLLGFEQRARRLRDWSHSAIPDQIVDRTQLGQSRTPAFLHLAVSDKAGIRHDLLLPDLPGEWTTRLLCDASTVDRFAFLSRADVLLVVVEAPTFANVRTRNNAVTDAMHLIARLTDEVGLETSIPIILAVTKCDQTSGDIPSHLNRVVDVVTKLGYSVSTVALAAFPGTSSQLKSGHGIEKLLALLTSLPAKPKTAAIDLPQNGGRSYFHSRVDR